MSGSLKKKVKKQQGMRQTYSDNGNLVPLYVKITSIDIKQLKGIRDCVIKFDKPLTAIMGVNGIGKSTILHALACCFQPENRLEKKVLTVRHKFSNFFPPSNDATWKDSNFTVSYDLIDGKGNIQKVNVTTTYHKDFDRWAPRYNRQPICDSYFIGIDTCVPDIENFKQQSIRYTTKKRNDADSQKILAEAAAILNKSYTELTDNILSAKKKYYGVAVDTLRYTSLSMGAGEQRVFRILETLTKAPKHTIILIDEIDLLLHPMALVKLVQEIYKIAEKNSLQVIFTTHSLVFNDTRLRKICDVKYLEKVGDRISVYDGIPSSAVTDMQGVPNRPIHIFVEDNFSKIIINSIAHSLNMQKKVRVDTFGAASNAFILAAGMVMQNDGDNSNTLIVLDGDVYRMDSDKESEIKKVLSGTEGDIDEKREKAKKLILQYQIPEGYQPEEFIHNLLCKSSEQDNEIVREAQKIQAVSNKHDFIDAVVNSIGGGDGTLSDIMHLCSQSPEWETYVKPIKNWLGDRRNI